MDCLVLIIGVDENCYWVVVDQIYFYIGIEDFGFDVGF